MIVEPKIRFPELCALDPEMKQELHIIPSTLVDGLFIECEAVVPKSAEGRKVTLRITPERADAMMLALREYNIQRRR